MEQWSNGARELLQRRMNDGVNVCALPLRALTLGDGCWLKTCWLRPSDLTKLLRETYLNRILVGRKGLLRFVFYPILVFSG